MGKDGLCFELRMQRWIPVYGPGAQAAVVMEPIHGYSGAVVYQNEILPVVSRICKNKNILYAPNLRLRH